MRSPEAVKWEICDRWLRRADVDLAVAEQLLADGVPYFVAIGFHAQQAAEKYLKAFLVWRQVEFPKTHDLGYLLQLLGTQDKGVSQSLQQILVLSDYGVDTWYPANLPDLSSTEASHAVDLAKQTNDTIVKSLSS